KTSNITRFSYASSDMAGQLVFCVVSFYILKFYTDVVGLSAGVAGTILLIARFEDALDTPIWGIFLDKTKSRHGKSRPWFLWLCFPFGLFGVLTFLSPDLDSTAKAIYAGATYIILGSLYTGINTPVTSILSSLTSDPKERVTLTVFRMFGSKAGVLLVNATFLPLVAWFGKGDDKLGYMVVMPIFAVVSIILYLFAFRNLKETIPVEYAPMPVKRAFQAFKGNWPWIIIFISCLFFWVAFIARITMVPYFFEYVWDRKDLVPLANSMDVLSLGSIFLIPWFCKWARKGTIWAWSLAGSVIAQFFLYAGLVTQSLPLLMVGWVFGILTSGVALALPFSMLAETVDYGEWKTGIRSAGLLTAIGTGFCLKAGSGLGGALPAWTLGATGYVANVEQTSEAIRGIEIGFIWLPAIFYALALVPVFFYRKFEILEPRIQEELSQRRSAAVNV
ncbi:MAG: MFS transporter, partial [Akkermansiaceae bacterium]|nr:MFS transporter [Akkermansiaceae bacterium]